jgi:hypothetical protein
VTIAADLVRTALLAFAALGGLAGIAWRWSAPVRTVRDPARAALVFRLEPPRHDIQPASFQST